MTRDEWLRVKDVAAGALDQPASGREAYVDARCGDDEAWRTEVRSLLASVATASTLYETTGVLIAGGVTALEALQEPTRVGERIGPYQIVRALGDGGMGAAYLAVRADGSYEQRVAIKLIKRGMDTAAILRRFRLERQTLADLDHPHIARLLDGGATPDGLPYFVMEYVEGEPLDAYCDRNRLGTAERLRVFLRVCDAVQHAHGRRVIHRDLKPHNILVTEAGVPKLLDFGISTAVAPNGGPLSTDEHTLLSHAMTPQYASPEQVSGGTIGVASDIYALGVLLYELLTGRRPYQLHGRTPQQVDDIICHEVPEKPSSVIDRHDDATAGRSAGMPESVSTLRDSDQVTLRRRLAGDLDNIVLMALRKEPARRYATVAALSADVESHLNGLPVHARADEVGYRAAAYLRRHRRRAIEMALAVAVVAAVGGAWWVRPSASRTIGGRVESLAIVPFTPVGDSEDVVSLADGLTESLLDSLSRLPALHVAARSLVQPLKGRVVDPRAVGRDLKVRAVLTGRVAAAGKGFEVGLELVDGGDGRRLWGARYDSSVSGLPALRERITRTLAETLAPGATGAQRQRINAGHSESGEAYQLYLKGRYVWNRRTEAGLTQGLGYFRQAIDKDPQYARAYSGLADCYNLLSTWGALSPRDAMPKVKAAALKAIALEPSLAEAHATLAFANWVYDWDWMAAAVEFEQAIDLDPGYATAHEWYAYHLASRHRFDDAIVQIRRAQEIDPVSASIGTDVGEIYYWAGQYGRAVDQLRSVLQLEPGFAMAHNIIGLTYVKMGRAQEAVTELEQAQRLATGPRMLSTLAYAYGVSGARTEAQRLIVDIQRQSANRYTSAFALALMYTGLGDAERALDQLELAFNERSDTMAILAVYPPLDGLRGQPRFRDLLRRVGHPVE